MLPESWRWWNSGHKLSIEVEAQPVPQETKVRVRRAVETEAEANSGVYHAKELVASQCQSEPTIADAQVSHPDLASFARLDGIFFGVAVSMKYHGSTLVTNNSLRWEHTITRKC